MYQSNLWLRAPQIYVGNSTKPGGSFFTSYVLPEQTACYAPTTLRVVKLS